MGIHWITTEVPDSEFALESMFGSVSFSGTQIIVKADHNAGAPGQSITIASDGDGRLSSVTGTTITANNQVTMNSLTSTIDFESTQGIEFHSTITSLARNPTMLFTADGVDNNGDFGIRYYSKGTGVLPMQIDVEGDSQILPFGEAHFTGHTVNLQAFLLKLLILLPTVSSLKEIPSVLMVMLELVIMLLVEVWILKPMDFTQIL